MQAGIAHYLSIIRVSQEFPVSGTFVARCCWGYGACIMKLLVALAGITMTRRSEFSKVKSRRCLNGLETMPCGIVGNVSLHPKVLNAFSGGVGPACRY
ncbi:hypothetical protein M0802_015915 [Mischocyttarus mexicanus]|nr:hypothetical protein M0802_015915 [Mischocyttarus mexicanus]